MEIYLDVNLIKGSHDFRVKGDKLCFSTTVRDYSNSNSFDYKNVMKVIPIDDRYVAVHEFCDDFDISNYEIIEAKKIIEE